MRDIRRILIVICLWGSVLGWAQQPRKIVAGLKTDSVYMASCQAELRLLDKQRTINMELGQLRAELSNNPQTAEQISSLELQLFALQSQLVDVSAKIDAIEQDWQIENISDTSVHMDDFTDNSADDLSLVGTTGDETANANLVYSGFFRNNLPAGDYSSLLAAQGLEAEIIAEVNEYAKRRGMLVRIDSAYYDAVSLNQCDSLFAERTRLAAENESFVAQLSKRWREGVFDTKNYCYNYILDKNNKTSMLDQVMEMSGEMYAEMESISDSCIVALASYPYQKRFLLRYEALLAAATGNAVAADSLKKVSEKLSTVEYAYSTDKAPGRATNVEYIQAEVVTPSKYNSRNPIPKCDMVSDGPVYSILLGRYSVLQAPAIFRNVYPLFYVKDENNKYCYYAGYYPTAATAEQAVVTLKSRGFKNPIAVKWEEGAQSVAPTPAVHSQTGGGAGNRAGAKGSAKFRVEIRSAGSALSAPLRSAITANAPGKELSRVVDGDTYLFHVGSFDNKATAEELVIKLKAIDGGVNIGVTEIQ